MLPRLLPSARPPTAPRTPEPAAALPPAPSTDTETGLPGAALTSGHDRLRPLFRIPTSRRIVFLTIDDGLVRTPEALTTLVQSGVPLTLFPTASAVAEGAPFFAALLAAGASLGDHTVTHPVLPRLTQARQVREVCAAAAMERSVLHRAPVMFRPPYGATSAAVARAARHCGMRYELLWNATVNDGVVRNSHGVVGTGNPLDPGDIVLMHFRTTFAEDFAAALAAARTSGLSFAPITAHLPAGSSDPAGITAQDDALAGWPAARHTLELGDLVPPP